MLRRSAATLVLALCLAGCVEGGSEQDGPSPLPAASASYRSDPSLFAADGEGGTRESLMVVGGRRDAVVAALQAAGRRWLYVTEAGEDLSRPAPDVARLEDAAAAGQYTPNFVHDVYSGARGPALLVDCKGMVPPAMARAFVAIVSEELRQRGVGDVVLTDAGTFTGDEPVLAEL